MYIYIYIYVCMYADSSLGILQNKQIHTCIYKHTYIHNSNAIADLGARYFAGALPHCGSLVELDLSYTYIGDEGAELIAQVCVCVCLYVYLYVRMCIYIHRR